jgi:hypothetical protein
MDDPSLRERAAQPEEASGAFSLSFTPLPAPEVRPEPADAASGKPPPRAVTAGGLPLPGLDVWSLDSRRKSLRGSWRFWSLNSRALLR